MTYIVNAFPLLDERVGELDHCTREQLKKKNEVLQIAQMRDAGTPGGT